MARQDATVRASRDPRAACRPPTVAVLVVTYNHEDEIVACIEAALGSHG